MSCFNWNTFLHWEMFLFSILTFWLFEMRKTSSVVRCIPPFLFFLKIPLCTTRVVWCALTYFFFFCWMDQAEYHSHEWVSLEFVNERKSYHKSEVKLGSRIQLSGGTWQVDSAPWFRLFRFYSWSWPLIHRSNSSEISNIASVFTYPVKR